MANETGIFPCVRVLQDAYLVIILVWGIKTVFHLCPKRQLYHVKLYFRDNLSSIQKRMGIKTN